MDKTVLISTGLGPQPGTKPACCMLRQGQKGNNGNSYMSLNVVYHASERTPVLEPAKQLFRCFKRSSD